MIKHVFANGKTTTDITGHIVKRAECPMVYEILERLNNESTNNRVANKHRTTVIRTVSGLASSEAV